MTSGPGQAAGGAGPRLRVGLTGGIGSGKSEVSARLAALGAMVIDADALAREVLAAGTGGLAEVVAAFGPAVLRPDGSLDREQVASLVFGNAAALDKLNSIVHPLVGSRMTELEQAAPPGAIVVHDVPLIAEHDLAAGYDLVVVVDVAPRIQLDRLVRHRGMTPDQAQARISAQASRDERLAIADIVVDNSGSLAELDRQAADLWNELRRRLLP